MTENMTRYERSCISRGLKACRTGGETSRSCEHQVQVVNQTWIQESARHLGVAEKKLQTTTSEPFSNALSAGTPERELAAERK